MPRSSACVDQLDGVFFLHRRQSQVRAAHPDERNVHPGRSQRPVQHFAFHRAGVVTRGMRPQRPVTSALSWLLLLLLIELIARIQPQMRLRQLRPLS